MHYSSWPTQQYRRRPVTSLAELSLAPVFRRRHGALYDALAEGAAMRTGCMSCWPASFLPVSRSCSCLSPRLTRRRTTSAGLTGACTMRRAAATVPAKSPSLSLFFFISAVPMVNRPGVGHSSWTLPVDARRLPQGACPVTATAGQIRDLAGGERPAGTCRAARAAVHPGPGLRRRRAHARAGRPGGPAAGAHRQRPGVQ